jgi:GAF domain-containing protein
MLDLNDLHENLARVVLVGRDLSEVLSDIVGVARKAMPAVEAASITLIRGDKAFTAAYDGQMALDADELQYERGYGPCIDAGLSGQTFLIEDMTTEDRWPDYARTAAAHGVGSSLSVPLPFQTATIGALNTYSSRSHAYSEDEQALGHEVATWIAVAVGTADAAAQTSDELRNMHIAMKTRAAIEQAKGILMERYKITEDRAFAVLTRASQTSNIKLRTIAQDLIDTGTLHGTDAKAQALKTR